MKFIVYTDGSCFGNGYDENSGGWGFVILDGNDNIVFENHGQENDTTNQRMELTALIEALHYCRYIMSASKADETSTFSILSDSAYIINCYKQKWYARWILNGWKNAKKEPVANRDLWEQIIPFFSSEFFDFGKVLGHSGVKWNEYVDQLARERNESICD